MNMGIIAASRLRAAALNPFIIEVDTSKAGSASDAFEFTGALGNYDVVAKQNDIVVATFNDLSGQQTITLPSSGVYDLEITPKATNGFNRIQFNNSGDKLKITDIKQWGDVVWSTFNAAFFGCSNMLVTATDIPNLSNVTDMYAMFRGASIANPNTTNWDVSNVTNMSVMFSQAVSFDQPLNSWDVSNVTNMRAMFSNADSFNQPLDNWDVSSVTTMNRMFSQAVSFDQPLNSWDVSNVTDMNRMFAFSDTIFNQPLNNWDVRNVTDMTSMFRDSIKFNQDLSGWCVSQIGSRPTTFDSGASSWVLPNSRPDWGAPC